MEKECPKCNKINHENYVLDMYPPIYCFICADCDEHYDHKNTIQEEDRRKTN